MRGTARLAWALLAHMHHRKGQASGSGARGRCGVGHWCRILWGGRALGGALRLPCSLAGSDGYRWVQARACGSGLLAGGATRVCVVGTVLVRDPEPRGMPRLSRPPTGRACPGLGGHHRRLVGSPPGTAVSRCWPGWLGSAGAVFIAPRAWVWHRIKTVVHEARLQSHYGRFWRFLWGLAWFAHLL